MLSISFSLSLSVWMTPPIDIYWYIFLSSGKSFPRGVQCKKFFGRIKGCQGDSIMKFMKLYCDSWRWQQWTIVSSCLPQFGSMKVALQIQLHFDKVFPSSWLGEIAAPGAACPAVLSWLIPAANVSFCQFNFVTFVDSVGERDRQREKAAGDESQNSPKPNDSHWTSNKTRYK